MTGILFGRSGSYVESSCEKAGDLPSCRPCPRLTYLAFDNYRSECHSCKWCDRVSMPLSGRTLYQIINVVPVRRWKELMRLLELKECENERIEMDVVHSRDQQYQMLRQCSQQQTTSMESLYQALEIMNLTGLGEELKTKLLNHSNSPHSSKIDTK